MKISLFVNTPSGMQILAKTDQIVEAIDLLKKIKADGVLLDIHTAKYLLTQKEGKTLRTHVSARTHQGIQRVLLQDIDYFQAEQKYVMVYHRAGNLLIEDTLKELETEFREHFIRIHRNLLVNKKEIESLTRDEQGNFWVKLKNQSTVFPVSRRRIAVLRKLMR